MENQSDNFSRSKETTSERKDIKKIDEIRKILCEIKKKEINILENNGIDIEIYKKLVAPNYQISQIFNEYKSIFETLSYLDDIFDKEKENIQKYVDDKKNKISSHGKEFFNGLSKKFDDIKDKNIRIKVIVEIAFNSICELAETFSNYFEDKKFVGDKEEYTNSAAQYFSTFLKIKIKILEGKNLTSDDIQFELILSSCALLIWKNAMKSGKPPKDFVESTTRKVGRLVKAIKKVGINL